MPISMFPNRLLLFPNYLQYFYIPYPIHWEHLGKVYMQHCGETGITQILRNFRPNKCPEQLNSLLQINQQFDCYKWTLIYFLNTAHLILMTLNTNFFLSRLITYLIKSLNYNINIKT